MKQVRHQVRLPTTQALRAFEAAARLGSFTEAAEELNQTASAISHQIRFMEDLLGAKLFLREKQRIKPSVEGVQLLPAVQQSLHALQDAISQLRYPRHSVRVSLLPSIANRFLIRRLGAFIAKHPRVDIYLSSTQSLVDLQNEGFDVAVRFGRGQWARTSSAKIADESLVPVVSPELIRTVSRSSAVALTQLPLLRDDMYPWARYLNLLGLRSNDATFGPRYGDSAQLLDAAEAGVGVGLARWWLARDALLDGSLVSLDLPRMKVEEAYYLVTPDLQGEIPEAPALLAAWISEQFEQDACPPEEPMIGTSD